MLLDDELYHHGILGMKWGIRRYQNEDGTYTKTGKKRHADTERADYHEDNPGASKRKLLNKNTVKKAAIIAGVAVGTVAIGYVLHKSGMTKKGFDAVSSMFNNGFGKVPVSKAKPSETTKQIIDANRSFSKAKAVSEAKAKRDKIGNTAYNLNNARINIKTAAANIKETKRQAGVDIQAKDLAKQSKQYKQAINNTVHNARKVSTVSSDFSRQSAQYTSFTDQLIAQFK